MMDKLFMATMVAVMVAGISVISSTMVHAGPSHVTQAEIAEWTRGQGRNLNPTL